MNTTREERTMQMADEAMRMFSGHFSSNQGRLPGFPVGSVGKESTCQHRRHGFDPSVGKISWRRKWQPTPVFSPGKSHGQRSLAVYSPWGCRESDMTEVTEHIHRKGCQGQNSKKH